MKTETSIVLMVALAAFILPAAAQALPSYSLDIVPGDAQNNYNVPKFILTNGSSEGEQIVRFAFSIGDDAHFFDFVLGAGSSPAATASSLATEAAAGASLVLGDRDNDRAGVDVIEWVFADFGVGEQLVFEVDVDPISAQSGGSQTDDASHVFFDNGAAPNSHLELVFDDGSRVDIDLPDPNGGPLHFEGGIELGVEGSVPEPGTSLLLGMGLVGTAFVGRRKA